MKFPARHVSAWILLALYWPVLLISTHIPKLSLGEFRVVGQDKTLHFFAYGLLALLFWLACFRGRRPSFRDKGLYLTLLLMAMVTGADEITQKYFHRDTEIHDWVADMIGVALALGLLYTCRRAWQWLLLLGGCFFLFTHWPWGSFMRVPRVWQPYLPIGSLLAHLTLTLLLWYSLGRSRFESSWQIGLVTILVIASYVLLDETVSFALGNDFSGKKLAASVLGIFTGCLAALALAQHQQAWEAERPGKFD